MVEAAGAEPARRERVLESAMLTFARFGYRKTSMEDVARAAGISRPGLYFLFASKPDLFRAAVVFTLDRDLGAAAAALAEPHRPLEDRLVEAFDHWTGRYIGPMAREVPLLMDGNRDVLGSVVGGYPERFAALVFAAIHDEASAAAGAAASDASTATLISAAIGIKQQVSTREEFLVRVRTAVVVILGSRP